MKFAQIEDDGTLLIEAYAADRVRVNGRDYSAGVAVSARRIMPEWGPAGVEALSAADIEALLETDPQVVILGTGARQHFPDPAVLAALMQRGIGIEVMDTGAACRTYNILASEGRRVVAALLPG
ncbi:MAG: Mth938-like domain-containing protein [Thiohalocapsa sp.]|nr:Mth938-like domain-containing protein [Thiohalocapsa sp.]MCF7992296.1 Mth938-like domain-containing protein [Thiohalocapsa sp.]